MKWAEGLLWRDIQTWSEADLHRIDAELWESGYEANLEASATKDPALKRRVERMWRLTEACNAERERRRVERVIDASNVR